ncbi:MAG TPA: biopolymer transporter Tol, partial [Opitutaceae bacterium]
MKFSSITRSQFILAAALLSASTALGARDLGTIDVPGDKAIGVKVTANSPDMQKLAQQAFSTHGRYDLRARVPSYEIRFTSLGPTQVKVDVTRTTGGPAVLSQAVSGTSARNALLRAADAVVEKTSNQNLKGFFASQLAFVITQRGNKGDVYVSDLYLGGAANVTQRNSHTLMPRWSPDGRRVIYTSYFNSGAPDIFTVDPTNGQKNIFANFRWTNMGARFSPNGQ